MKIGRASGIAHPGGFSTVVTLNDFKEECATLVNGKVPTKRATPGISLVCRSEGLVNRRLLSFRDTDFQGRQPIATSELRVEVHQARYIRNLPIDSL